MLHLLEQSSYKYDNKIYGAQFSKKRIIIKRDLILKQIYIEKYLEQNFQKYMVSIKQNYPYIYIDIDIDSFVICKPDNIYKKYIYKKTLPIKQFFNVILPILYNINIIMIFYILKVLNFYINIQ